MTKAPRTTATNVSVQAFIDAVPDAGRRADAFVLLDLFARATGREPVMWGPSIIGYGRYRYVYESGHSGEAPLAGFSPRKANMVLYFLTGFEGQAERLARLGKHKLGSACLYLGRLSGVDLEVLEDMVRRGVEETSQRWDVLA